MKPLLAFENVCMNYRMGVTALKNVSFTIYDGEFVFLIGPSGAGKSTVAKLAILEEQPTAGKIYFEGKDTSAIRNSNFYKLRRDIGVIFQNFRLLNNRTIQENLAFVLEVIGIPEKDIIDQVEYTLDLVGLADKALFFPEQLSGGEQQRATIARAVVSQPKLLIADEPTGNLDDKNTWDIVQLFNKINSWGTTVIIASHDQEVVDSLQRRVIGLVGGALVRDSSGGYHTAEKEPEKKTERKASIKQQTKSKKSKGQKKDEQAKEEGKAKANKTGKEKKLDGNAEVTTGIDCDEKMDTKDEEVVAVSVTPTGKSVFVPRSGGDASEKIEDNNE